MQLPTLEIPKSPTKLSKKRSIRSQVEKPKKKEWFDTFMEKSGAKDSDFHRVHKDWLAKTISFDNAIDQLETFADGTRDVAVTADCAIDFGNDYISVNGASYQFSEAGVKTVCSKLGLPAEFMNRLSSSSSPEAQSLFMQSVKYGLAQKKDRGFKLRLRGDNIRGLVSNNYMDLDNLWYMNVLKEAVPDGRVSHWKADGDSMNFSVLIPDSFRTEKDSDYGGGIQANNNEIGGGKLRSKPYLFRAICCNGLIWGAEEGNEVAQIHLGSEEVSVVKARLRERILLNIQRQIPLANEALMFLFSLKETTVPKEIVTPTIIDLSQRFSLTQRDTLGWMAGYDVEPHESAFGIVNGLTRFSQECPTDSQNRLETVAGELTSMDDLSWERAFERAERMESEVLEKTQEKYSAFANA